MRHHVGKTDRLVRVIIGLAIIWAGFYYESWWGILGLIPLVTAVLGHCPAYIPFRISATGREDK